MTTDWTRIAKLAGMLGSDHDGEILAAVAQIRRELAARGLTWADFANRIDGSAPALTVVDWDNIYAKHRAKERMRRDQEEAARQTAARQRGEW